MQNNINKEFWIYKTKLRPFLIGLSFIVTYDLSINDIDAIEYGIFDTSDEKSHRLTYCLLGETAADLSLALDEENRDILFISIEISTTQVKELELLIFIIDAFELKETQPLN